MKWSLVGRIGVARMSQAKQFFGQTLNFLGTSEWPKYKKNNNFVVFIKHPAR